ncbi:hypothetical protein [Lignipirellula cremea]|uniref:Uncharacterized protein n=1 Tax=Lignipirellula cremea TaxID=2528010 RepID=A0A518E3P6_9BACT|nr:hypothetical protein [Lignipirellula cremea]QDU98663.1 hypothetical protein Pla8534_65350 [Lignipirellula cremea]
MSRQLPVLRSMRPLACWFCCFLLLAGLVGCDPLPPGPKSAVPGLPGEHPLVGRSLSHVVAKLGQPDSQSEMKNEPHFGPFPASLLPTETCTNLYYADYQGEQTHVFLVTPAIYERIHGKSPGAENAYVLEVYTYPQGTVF